jgi:hypothetical protein
MSSQSSSLLANSTIHYIPGIVQANVSLLNLSLEGTFYCYILISFYVFQEVLIHLQFSSFH